MPNYCNFQMKIKGQEENVKTLIEWLRSNYTYMTDGDDYPWTKEETLKERKYHYQDGEHHLYTDAEKHFWRVFELYNDNEDYEGEDYVAYVFGYCAWSVYCCMFSGPHTYSNTSDDDQYYNLKLEHSTNMSAATRMLGLEVEIVSYEPGMCFAEHYVVKDGDIVEDESFEYNEYFLDHTMTKEEVEKEYGISIPDAEWETQDYIIQCEIDPLDPMWSI